MSTLASAQMAVYDAGTVTNPSIASDPQSQGWGILNLGSTQKGLIAGNGPGALNSWKMAGTAGCSSGSLSYWQPIVPYFSYEFSMEAHIVASGSTGGAFMSMNTGTTSSDDGWSLRFRTVGNDVVVSQQGWNGTYTFTCPDGALGFHRYAIRRTSSLPLFTAEFVYDGVVLGTMESFIPSFSIQEECSFGISNCSTEIRVHQVDLLDANGISVMSPCSGLTPNSTGMVGHLAAFGSVDVAGPGFTLLADLLPPNSTGFFLVSFGTGSLALPGSQGHLCLDPASISRAWGPNGPMNSGSSGQFSLRLDPLNMPINPPGPVGAGTLYFQAWHQDANPMPTSNVSRAIAVTLQ